MKIVQEFKSFALKGNAVDMAVGIVIGGGFGKIVAAFVADVVMPPIGMLMGGVNFADLKIVLKGAQMDEAKQVMKEAVTINYGHFLQVTVDFLIVAVVIFLVIRAMNSLKKKEEAAPSAPPAPSKEVVLLTDIRDLLKKK